MMIRVGNFWNRNYIEYESNRDRNKTLSTEEYFNKIRPYLKDITNNLKKLDTIKIQLTIAINFLSFKNNDEERATHSKSDNIEIMINDKADEVTKSLFQSLLCRYQIGLDSSMKGSELVFDCVQLLYYKFHKINPNSGASHIDSCNVVMTSEDTKLLQFNQYHKSDKAPFIIYINLKSLMVKIDGCKNNLEKSSTENIS